MPNLPVASGFPSPSQVRADPVTVRELDIVRVAAALVSGAVILAGLYFGREILIPLAIAFLITFALNPPVTWLARLGLPRLLATSLVMVTVGCALVGLGVILGAQVRSIAVELPAYQSTILTKLADLRQTLKAPGLFDGVLKTVERVQKEVESKDDKPAEGPVPQRVEIVPMPQTPFEQAFAWLVRSAEP
ncbi:AI-2E family transporter [Bradyrhizobium sp. TZ2]